MGGRPGAVCVKEIQTHFSPGQMTMLFGALFGHAILFSKTNHAMECPFR
jgi:hypothetical protein